MWTNLFILNNGKKVIFMKRDDNNTNSTKREEDRNFGLTNIQRECKETGPVIATLETVCDFIEKIVINF